MSCDHAPTSDCGADESVAEEAELLSVHPTAVVEEAAPATSQSIMAPQERDAPKSMAMATSPEIQETREGLWCSPILGC